MSVFYAKDLAYEQVWIFGTPALFVTLHVDPATVPDGLNLYDIRDTDDGAFGSVEEYAIANHAGCVLTTYGKTHLMGAPHDLGGHFKWRRNFDKPGDFRFDPDLPGISGEFLEEWAKAHPEPNTPMPE